MAVKLGAAKFIIPFVFAYYPGMLLADFFELDVFLWATARLFLVIYLISTCVSMFDRRHLYGWEGLLRLPVAAGILVTVEWVQFVSIAIGFFLIASAWFVKSQQARLGKVN